MVGWWVGVRGGWGKEEKMRSDMTIPTYLGTWGLEGGNEGSGLTFEKNGLDTAFSYYSRDKNVIIIRVGLVLLK